MEAGRKRVWLSLVLALSFCSVSLIVTAGRRAAAQQPQQAPKTAEQVFKNIQVIKSMPAGQLQSTMSFMSASLGVDCTYCHIPPAMEKDDKPTKQTARRMLSMVAEINKNFGDQRIVNCATCHRGKTKPVGVPPLPSLSSPFVASTTGTQEALPTIDAILNGYLQAVGGEKALDKITTRMRTGFVDVQGQHGTFELYEGSPNKSLLIGSLPAPLGSVQQAFDGTRGWVKNQSGVFDMSGSGLEQVKREAVFWGDVRLKEQFKSLTVAGRERVDGRDLYLVSGTRTDGQVERLFFDVQSKLLVRRYWASPTYFGDLPNATDYYDYRKVGSLRLPFLIRKLRNGTSFVQTISEYKLNVKLDDEQFKKPLVKK